MKVINTTTQVIHVVHIHREGKQIKHTPMALQPGEHYIDSDTVNDLAQQPRWQELIEHGFITYAKGKDKKTNNTANDVN